MCTDGREGSKFASISNYDGGFPVDPDADHRGFGLKPVCRNRLPLSRSQKVPTAQLCFGPKVPNQGSQKAQPNERGKQSEDFLKEPAPVRSLTSFGWVPSKGVMNADDPPAVCRCCQISQVFQHEFGVHGQIVLTKEIKPDSMIREGTSLGLME